MLTFSSRRQLGPRMMGPPSACRELRGWRTHPEAMEMSPLRGDRKMERGKNRRTMREARIDRMFSVSSHLSFVSWHMITREPTVSLRFLGSLGFTSILLLLLLLLLPPGPAVAGATLLLFITPRSE